MTKNKTKNWIEIEEEFRNKMSVYCFNTSSKTVDKVLAFFKPYFQEILHDNVVEELEVKTCNSGGKIFLSMPPQYKCINCERYWFCDEESPVCKAS